MSDNPTKPKRTEVEYFTILADPPWQQPMTGKYNRRDRPKMALSYPTIVQSQR